MERPRYTPKERATMQRLITAVLQEETGKILQRKDMPSKKQPKAEQTTKAKKKK